LNTRASTRHTAASISSPAEASTPSLRAISDGNCPVSASRSDAAERATGSECGVELTEVRSGAESWWSLGFEATGPADSLRSTLEAAAALMFAQAPLGDVEFDLGHCQSYVEWLSRLRVTRRNSPAGG
jgi:hypothetical protein